MRSVVAGVLVPVLVVFLIGPYTFLPPRCWSTRSHEMSRPVSGSTSSPT